MVFSFIYSMSCGGNRDSDRNEREVFFSKDCGNKFPEIREFQLGVCLTSQQIKNPPLQNIIKKYEIVTPEYQFKMDEIVPEENVYNWKESDIIYDFSEKNNINIFGHALVWHRSNPRWLYKYDKNPAVLEQKVKEYWKKIVIRYPKVLAWDVVNEAIDVTSYRNDIMYKNFSESYIEMAFRYVHELNPNAILFYNDYNLESNKRKRDAVISMIKSLLRKKVPIHGIGLQFHWDMTSPTKKIAKEALSEIISLGLKIHFSEVDVQLNVKKNKIFEPTREALLQQAWRYKEVANLFMSIPKELQFGITFWGVTDATSWISYEYGYEDAATIFAKDNTPKSAYFYFFRELSPSFCQ